MHKNAYFWKKSCKIAATSGPPNPSSGSELRLRTGSELRLRTPANLQRLEALPPETSTFLLSPTALAFVECVSSIKRTLLIRNIAEVVTHSKCFGLFFSALSCLFFASNSGTFVGSCAKIFLPPGVWHPYSYATEKIIGVGLVCMS